MAAEIVNGPTHFELNTGTKIPSVGLGTWKAAPGEVGQAVIHAIKVCWFSILSFMQLKYIFLY